MRALATVAAATFVVVTLAGVLSAGELRAQTDEVARPDAVNPVERNAVEYKSDRLQVIAAHYYFRGAHDRRWLLIDLGVRVMSGRPVTVARHDISIVGPDGVRIELASQREYRRARAELLPLHVQLHTRTRSISAHFIVRCSDHSFRFFVDSGIRQTEVYANRIGPCVRGDLYFASPTGAWQRGTYTLVIGGDTDVRLPIEIE